MTLAQLLDALCIGVGAFLLWVGVKTHDPVTKVTMIIAAAVMIGSTVLNWDFKGTKHESVAADQPK